ncbi:MAG: metallophosphoesterase [Oscillospiraceae bacterium]|nr:metallophosphoesterase [Oscillospiraceae bacterium]
MKKLFSLLISALLCALPCSAHAETAPELRLLVASDLHYLAPSLTDNGNYYQRVLANGDSKFMPYIEEITEAFLEEVISQKPDALLLTGDLTFNGAIISHEALIQKLKGVEEEGIPVLVLTGNHDVYNRNAASFHGDGFTRVPYGTSELFAELYADFGFQEALSIDEDSLSYIYPLGEKVRILMLDLNTENHFCSVSPKTFRWIEEQLENARTEGCKVLAAGHQNLYQHSIFRGGYVISEANQLGRLLRQYGVSLFLSGHMHIQHIKEKDGLTEITTSALPSYPCQYGDLQLTEDQAIYQTRRLDMKAWADRHGRTEAVFSAFQEAAAQYMAAHISKQADNPNQTADGTRNQMAEFFRALNLAYFSGDLSGIPEMDPDGAIAEKWMEQQDMIGAYISSIRQDIGKTYTEWAGQW